VWEGGRIRTLVPDDLVYQHSDSRLRNFAIPPGVASKEKIEKRVEAMKGTLSKRNGRSNVSPRALRRYFWSYMFCELLNLINVIGQIFFTDKFLGGMFLDYGGGAFEAANKDPEERDDPLNRVFPKVAKCTFQKYGPTGTIEKYDGLCVLPVNIINEKIYIFLWYWLVILTIVTGIYAVYRLLTICSRALRKATLKLRTNGLASPDVLDRVSDQLTVSEWFFVCMLGANLDPYVFKRLLDEMDRTSYETSSFPHTPPTPSIEDEAEMKAEKEAIDKLA